MLHQQKFRTLATIYYISYVKITMVPLVTNYIWKKAQSKIKFNKLANMHTIKCNFYLESLSTSYTYM